MWVFLNDAFVSIVQHRDKPDTLMVRARIPGDLERLFPGVPVVETRWADYRFRVEVSKPLVMAILAHEVEKISYPNFKDSVADQSRHDAYMGVWSVMWAEQGRRLGDDVSSPVVP